MFLFLVRTKTAEDHQCHKLSALAKLPGARSAEEPSVNRAGSVATEPDGRSHKGDPSETLGLLGEAQ